MKGLYTKQELKNAFHAVGVRAGDTLFLHSNIGFFGILEGANGKEEYCSVFLDVLLDAVGGQGNICVPTFTYSFCKGQDFDPENTPSGMGSFVEYVRMHPQALRSHDANFSIAVIGPMAKALTENAPEHSFGKDSFGDRLIQCGAKLCNMNFDAASTIVHHIEKRMNVPYRQDKQFSGRVFENGQWKERRFIHYVRPLDNQKMNTDMEKVSRMAREDNLFHQVFLGRGSILYMELKQFSEVFCEKISQNPYCLTVAGNRP